MRTADIPRADPMERIPAAAFGVVVVLWAVFGAVALIEPARMDALWEAFRAWPLPAQLAGWILLLPWVLASMAWGADWALWARLPVVGLIAVFTLVAFSPKRQ